jgi:hypothetical protein
MQGVQGIPCLKKAEGFNPHDERYSDKSYVQTGNRLFWRRNILAWERCLLLSSTPVDFEKMEKEPSPVDITLLDLYQLLEVFVMLLSEQAWRYIGLRVYPGTNEIRKDLVKAHVAVDCIIALVDKLEPHLEGEEKERLRRLITDLQINYAQQMK